MLVSIGGDEKVIIVWEKAADADPKNPESWRASHTQKDAHPATINYLTTYGENPEELYFITMCSSGVLKLWSAMNDAAGVKVTQKSELLFGRNL